MNLNLVDEWWYRPTAMAEAFQSAMDKQPEGIPEAEFNITDTPIDAKIKSSKKETDDE